MKTWNYLVIPLVSWTIAQVMKVTLESIKVRRINLRGLAETGGMPSSHSAIVAGLTTAVGRFDGLNSAAFAVALIFTFVVMYDATGVRRAVSQLVTRQHSPQHTRASARADAGARVPPRGIAYRE